MSPDLGSKEASEGSVCRDNSVARNQRRKGVATQSLKRNAEKMLSRGCFAASKK